MEDLIANSQSQAQLYGEPLAPIIEQIGRALGLTQGRIAQILGLSAPMLSHLVSARRVKIGNPMAHTRLTQLRALAAEVAAGRVSRSEAVAVLPEIEANNDSWTTSHALVVAMPTESDDAALVRRVQELFRDVADAADWLDAAQQVEATHPRIAEVLRVYGASRTASAQEHWHRQLGGPA